MADSTAIDAAVLALLNGDAALVALIPDRVWFNEAPQESTRFGIVSLIDGVDTRGFDGRVIEERLYLVKVVIRTTVPNAGPTMQSAAARIDELLEDALLTATGFDPMTCYRDQPIRYDETDVVDPAIRFMHCGGQYRVFMSVQ